MADVNDGDFNPSWKKDLVFHSNFSHFLLIAEELFVCHKKF